MLISIHLTQADSGSWHSDDTAASCRPWRQSHTGCQHIYGYRDATYRRQHSHIYPATILGHLITAAGIRTISHCCLATASIVSATANDLCFTKCCPSETGHLPGAACAIPSAANAYPNRSSTALSPIIATQSAATAHPSRPSIVPRSDRTNHRPAIATP